MPPRLVPCNCDPDWPAMAVCSRCELRWLADRIAARDALPEGHPALAAYQAVLDANDRADRARARVDEHMAGRP